MTRDGSWTLLGPGSVVRGDLLLTGDVLIHGRVEGLVVTDGTVHIDAEGSMEGGLRARRVIVEGTCRGRIEATESIRIHPRAYVQAEVHTETLIVDPGARFFGERSGPDRRDPKAQSYQDGQPGQA